MLSKTAQGAIVTLLGSSSHLSQNSDSSGDGKTCCIFGLPL
jgi:hypothetical protein